MTVTIRPLSPPDADSWRTLWTAYLKFYGTTLPDVVYETTWERLLGDSRYDPRGLIAEVDGRAAGLAIICFSDTAGALKTSLICRISLPYQK